MTFQDGRCTIKNGAKTLYNDIPEAEAQYWESQLLYQSYAVQTTKLTRAAYNYVPSTYLVCERDATAPVQVQEMFAASVKAKEILRMDTGHAPMLSRPTELAALIDETIKKAAKSLEMEI